MRAAVWEIYAALSQVRRFFELHGESRFSPWEMALSGDFRTVNRAGFRRANDHSETVFYTLREVFKAEICAGRTGGLWPGSWRIKGYSYAPDSGRLTRTERLPGLGNTPCYRLTTRLLVGED